MSLGRFLWVAMLGSAPPTRRSRAAFERLKIPRDVEEFLIVLHGPTSARQAGDVAERLRAAVEQLDVSSVAAGLRVTISLGVCVTNEHDPKTGIAAVDALLYRAKENGRNRVEGEA